MYPRLAIETGQTPELWNELVQVVEKNRHYLIHPKPTDEEWDQFISQSMVKNPWSFAPRVASDIIGYFYEDFEADRNEWFRQNQEFSFPIIKLHQKQNT